MGIILVSIKIIFREKQWTVSSMESVGWKILGDTYECGHIRKKIFGDGFARSTCMDTMVARPITSRRTRNMVFLAYGLAKVKYLSFADWVLE